MISHKHKCIFVEVPKTGSTSVRAILGKAWKPHLNLWEIKNQMETYWTRYGGRKNRILAGLYLFLPEERRREIGRKQFRSEEHTSELQSLTDISYAVFCLKKKK